MNWPLLQNSLLVAGLATALALTFGLAVALCAAGLTARGRRSVLIFSAVALVLPPFLVTNSWLHFLGHTGVWRAWLPLDIYSLGGTAWILALLTWPVTTFTVLGSLRGLRAEHLEADAALTGGKLLADLLWPFLRPAIGQAAVLTFALALGNFAVPAILQTKVFPAEIWVSFNTTFDYLAALKLSWPLLLLPLSLRLFFHRREWRWPQPERPVPAKLFCRQLGSGWFAASAFITVGVLFLSLGLPLVQLLGARRTWSELSGALSAGQGALVNSFLLAALTATATVGLGLGTWRWRAGFLLWVPFLLPGVLLGITLIWLFNRPPFVAFYQSFGIVLLAWTLRYLAIGWQGAAAARRGVDRDLTDAARLDGASRWQLLRDIHWPQMRAGVAAAWYVTYLLCLWDVESLVLVVPPGGETVALRIFNLLHYGHNAQVDALCVALLALAVLPLILAAGFSAWQKFSPRHPMAKRAAAIWAFITPVVLFTSCQPPAAKNIFPVSSGLFSGVQIIGTRGTGAGQLNKPRSVAVDAQDNLYVVDMTGRVQKFSPGGNFLLTWQMPQTDKGRPKGMCADELGNIVVVEPHYQRVNHFTTDGKLVRQWGAAGTNSGQFMLPRDAVVNRHGEIYVCEYAESERVQRFSPQGGEFMGGFGRPGEGAGEFNRAEGLGVDARDQIYVADSCNHRIQIFSREGRFVRAYGRAGKSRGELSYPYDVAVDSEGHQFVCEFGNSRVQIFDAQDRPREILGEAGAAPGQFANPWGIALDSHGNLYVADSQNHRVQKFLRREPLLTRGPAVPGSGGAE